MDECTYKAFVVHNAYILRIVHTTVAKSASVTLGWLALTCINLIMTDIWGLNESRLASSKERLQIFLRPFATT